MKKKASRIFMIAGIRNLLRRNYKIEDHVIDVEAHIDDTLTFSENWKNIKDKFVKPMTKEIENK